MCNRLTIHVLYAAVFHHFTFTFILNSIGCDNSTGLIATFLFSNSQRFAACRDVSQMTIKQQQQQQQQKPFCARDSDVTDTQHTGRLCDSAIVLCVCVCVPLNAFICFKWMNCARKSKSQRLSPLKATDALAQLSMLPASNWMLAI